MSLPRSRILWRRAAIKAEIAMTDDSAILAKTLRELYIDSDELLRERYHRSLPLAEAILDDRWERAKRLGFGEGASIYNSTLVIGDVAVGAQTWIGPHGFLDGGYAPVTIGQYVSISSGVFLYSHDTVQWSLTGGRADKRVGPITVEDSVYIGSQTIIGPGVCIGRQSVVACNSFVNRDVPPLTIVAGTPAVQIGNVQIVGDEAKLIYK
jgi:acetyltransferase-like isoleucine patch superfamily enzyme